VNFPPRVILALVAVAVFAVIAVWGIVAVLRAKRLTAGRRMAGIGGIILIAALLIALVAFIWPAYWD
jgi:CHASE2 domain-containing sensor protein